MNSLWQHRMPRVATFGENVVRLLAERGWQQKDLAKRMGRTTQHVNNWTNADNVELHNLLRIATALELSVERVVEGIDADYDAMRQAAQSRLERLLQASQGLTDAQLEALQLLVERFLDRSPAPPPAAPAHVE